MRVASPQAIASTPKTEYNSNTVRCALKSWFTLYLMFNGRVPLLQKLVRKDILSVAPVTDKYLRGVQ